MRLNDSDRTRIAEAVAAAERRTTGEILCVITRQVSAYREIPLAYATLAALGLPPLALWLGLQPLDLAARLGQWSAGHAAAEIALVLGGYALVQAAIFAVTALVVSIPPVRRILTPTIMKARRVRRAAMAHFAATGLDGSPERTGVVIFAALDEHRVEVIADALINDRCGTDAWKHAVAAIRDGIRAGDPGGGFAHAVEICAEVLARHFPDDGGPNRMPDRPVEL